MLTIILSIILVILSILNTCLLLFIVVLKTSPDTLSESIQDIQETVKEVLTPKQQPRVISPLNRSLNDLNNL